MRFTPLNGVGLYLTGASLDQNDATRREKYLNISWEDVFKKKAQILFNRVKRDRKDVVALPTIGDLLKLQGDLSLK